MAEVFTNKRSSGRQREITQMKTIIKEKNANFGHNLENK